MDDPTLSMKEIQSEQKLLRDCFHCLDGQSPICKLRALKNQMMAKDIEYKAHMRSIWAFMFEMIQRG